MKLRIVYLISGIIVLLLIGLVFARLIFGGGEDTWIKNGNGIWIKHGNPSTTPDYVLEQQQALSCAADKFLSLTGSINSQCLGICEDYAVDIAHVPRTEEDDLAENQCMDYVNGIVQHFIELDREGNIIRIV